jgi:hypothetical protein
MKLLIFLTTIAAASAGEWVNISGSVTATVKPGYAGPTAGVCVDAGSGSVFMVVNDQGLWRSTDHGAKFTRCDDKAIGGRGETGWALQPNPAGKGLACFMIYGDSAMTTDGGATWTKWKSSHFDFGGVDWNDTGKRLLALRHESGGMLATSDDAGATWHDLSKGFSGCGVISRSIFVATKEKDPGIFRSTDTGATWTKVSDEKPSAGTPVLRGSEMWWPSGSGLLVSRDNGATWQKAGTPVAASYGPFFKTAEHFTVAGKDGFMETKDAGKTWTKAAPLPDGFNANRVGPFYAWDPAADIFYASGMMHPALKYERSRQP